MLVVVVVGGSGGSRKSGNSFNCLELQLTSGDWYGIARRISATRNTVEICTVAQVFGVQPEKGLAWRFNKH
jgi:hypothetical protein